MQTLLREFRYSFRGLIQSRGFAAIAVLTLALGIGACTAIFSVVDAVLLRALPYPNAGQIVRVWEQAPNGHRMNLADPNFDDFHAQNSTFAALAAYESVLASVSGGSEPVRVNIAVVSRDFFDVLGAAPVRGRKFSTDEMRVNGAPAALVSWGYWHRYLGGSADFSKFRLTMEGHSYTVVGVMPAGFQFPAATSAWVAREIYQELPSRTAHNWRGLGRIRNGLTVAQARADLGAIAHRINQQYGKDADLNNAAVLPLADSLVGDVRTALITLLGAVGLMLLVACANVAGLLIARAAARRKELAVRVALGAGRGRLMQQFLAESFSLSCAAGVVGILLATWAVRVLPAILPANLPRRDGIAVNVPVLLFALAATVMVAVLLGLFSAWRAARGDLQEALTAGSRSYTGTGASQQLRAFLVVGEIAMTLVILIGAGLLGRSFLRLISTNPGFQTQNLVTMQFSVPLHQWVAEEQSAVVRQAHVMDEILARLHTMPGVQSAGLAGAVPVAAGDNLADGTFLLLNGQKPPTTEQEFDALAHNPEQSGHASYCVAGRDYFRTLGIRVIRGRLFGDEDTWSSQHVAVISESLARRRWHDQDPVGQVIFFGNMDGNPKPLTIVGVVGDVRASGLDLPPASIIYVDYHQRGMKANSSPTVLLRTGVPLAEVVAPARAIFRDLTPDAPVTFSTLDNEMGGWLAQRRFLLLLVGLFAAVALALAAVGIYGVVAFAVTRRTQEIGIRMALGAKQSDVLRLVVGEGARLALLGVAAGIVASFGVTRVLSSLLFDISATDPVTYLSVAAALCGVALLASYLPARRAMRLDPNDALRYE